MDQDVFAVALPLLVSGLINKIIDETNISENEAFEKLYNSKLYELLEDEKTKMWTFSVPMLFDFYLDEIKTGSFKIPAY